MTTDPVHDAAQHAPETGHSTPSSGEEEIVDGRNPTQRRMDEEIERERAKKEQEGHEPS